MIIEHALQETGLFTDEALADMLDKHPSNLIDFQYVVNEPDYPVILGAPPPANRIGAHLFAATRWAVAKDGCAKYEGS